MAQQSASAPSELDELIDFLASQRLDVRSGAVDIVLGLTGSPEGLEQLAGVATKLLVFLLRLMSDPDAEVARKVLTCVVNMSTHEGELTRGLHRQNVVNRCMEQLRNQETCAHPRLLVMILSNLTATNEAACRQLLQLDSDKLQGLNISILLKRFVMSGIMSMPDEEDAYEHVAAVLTNVTRFKEARTMLLQPGRGTLQALAAQLQAPSELRRRGVAGAIRNCIMSTEEDGTLEHVVADPAVLSCMLVPISGKPAAAVPPGQEQQPQQPAAAQAPPQPGNDDEHVRECMAESIMVLAGTEAGREALWTVKAPDRIQKGYEYESVPSVCKALEAAAEEFITHSQVVNAVGGAPRPAAAE